MNGGTVAARYTAIAVVASLANLALQRAWMAVDAGPFAVEVAALLATGLVLPFKYVADKRWIFGYRTVSGLHDLHKLLHYTTASVFTVAIFWIVEFGAWRLFRTPAAQYLGAALGLALSFQAKYLIDKRFVFR
ncbi:MAG TPA: GtrA family protein [Ramlibacter sp.]|jgi:putative flippase GtrA|uniref:GtrA family protein n=1 Tax=Ramlibacter sp. TaxID=1917967 RepID=UPI002D2F9C74|nr:GtrA family protein [Ramlibacter sp.]HZY18408.1 GtrA family protein [Ramlibacter sp.]